MKQKFSTQEKAKLFEAQKIKGENTK